MRTLRFLMLVPIVSYALCSWAEDVYPKFTRPQAAPFSLPLNQAGSEVNALLAKQMGREPGERVEPGIELQTWLRQNRLWATDQREIFRNRLDRRMWPLVTAEGRMPLPSVLANNGSGLVSGIDCMWSIHNLADDSQSALAIMQYGMFWQIVFDNDPALAVSWLTAKTHGSEVVTAEIVELQSALGYWPGSKLSGSLSKKDWQSLYQSTRPLNRFIALEKFDSVEQSPAELLALYRECLFGACSYLEVRALEAIAGNADFREEVAKLLEEYVASNPPANDGTLPHLRNNFPNLIEGAQRVIATIRGSSKPSTPAALSSDPFGTQATPTKSMPVPKNLDVLPELPREKSSSPIRWRILGAMIAIASVVIWVAIKKLR